MLQHDIEDPKGILRSVRQTSSHNNTVVIDNYTDSDEESLGTLKNTTKNGLKS
jgi:hypothetical protein